MPSIYQLKPAFQRLLHPLINICSRLKITPNQVTLVAFLLSLIGGSLIWNAPMNPTLLLAIPLILLLRMALNALDGMLARTLQLSTATGEILNEVGDVVSDMALYLPLIVFSQTSSWSILMIFLFVALSILSEFSGILSKAISGVRRYDGPLGKSDRAFAIAFYCIVLYWNPTWVCLNNNLIFLILNSFLLLSCVNRLKAILEK
jgi:CDP-diacylglycerol--glycerol-3-phosphate 3-phosphatidyltransferase